MQKITDLSKYRNKKILMDEAEKLIDFIFEQAKQGKATHKCVGQLKVLRPC